MAQRPTTQFRTDVLIIGGGLAGLTAALHLAERCEVTVLCKGGLLDGASARAQGGIAVAWDEHDTPDQHLQDTLVAGGGLNDHAAVRQVVDDAKEAVSWLVNNGVPFTREHDDPARFHLTREGGHGARRVMHAADATGRAIQETLIDKVLKHPRITVREERVAIDLITGAKLWRSGRAARTCHGAYAFDRNTRQVETYAARATILATGGAGKVYLYTTNPDAATGDGIAMAWRAGCRVANMEFIQFHPTCLYHSQAKSFLISEAVRGEGGILRLPAPPGQQGHRFMPDHDARAELAPRDVVARAIDFEMKKRGLDCVYLDVTHLPEAFLQEHFPTIAAHCREFGIDIARQAIPVVPATHYLCGGVVVDLRARTDLAQLYAIGETACTGLHGANRLASNSLLECVVFGRAAAADILAQQPEEAPELPAWDETRVTDADEEVVISNNWDELRRFMWNYVGIVRTNRRLERAARRIRLLQEEIHDFYARFRVSNDLLELRNLVQTAELIVRCAQARHESRGLHFNPDYPEALPAALPTVLTPESARDNGRGPGN